MKITLSSPDGIGDFILRLPLINALQEAGHVLQLFMRQPAADLAGFVLAGTEIQIIRQDPYHQSTKRQTNPFKAEHQAIRRFRPDVYAAALFHLNFFDQVWIERGHGEERLAGFSCDEDFWSSGTTCDPRDLARQFAISVPVGAGIPELEKNRRLAEALLGRSVESVTPRLEPSPASLGEARGLLKQHGLKEGSYWITCVGTRPGVDAKDWGEKNWMNFFGGPLLDQPLLFLGNPKESASIERILADLPPGPRRVNLAANPPEIAISLALIALSAGYVGRDSGVMHMAAAVGRPVLAVFGGGHWGRFLPVAKSGVVVTQDWPCRGCEFCCAHDGADCIRGVPLSAMTDAWRILRSDPPDGLQTIEVPMPAECLEDAARTASRRYARVTQEFARWKNDQERPVNWLDALGLRLRSLARKKHR